MGKVKAKSYRPNFKVICQSSGERKKTKTYYLNDLYPAKFGKSVANNSESSTSSTSSTLLESQHHTCEND